MDRQFIKEIKAYLKESIKAEMRMYEQAKKLSGVNSYGSGYSLGVIDTLRVNLMELEEKEKMLVRSKKGCKGGRKK